MHAGSLNGALLAVLALVPLAAFELVSPLAGGDAGAAAGRGWPRVGSSTPWTRRRWSAIRRRRPHSATGRTRSRCATCGPSYPGAGRAALRGVDLELRPGRRVALVGPSGAGKSTLADVLVRFLPADDGDATLDGVPLERLAAEDVRRVVGLVEQHPHLFDTTLAENLRIGRRRRRPTTSSTPRSTRVGLGGWLEGLPEGLATPVGTMGGRLSGGQRQRVAVARALLADFPVLVLDEPAEHLEPAAADALTADLARRSTEGRATLLITHRLAGLEAVDEIVVLDGGPGRRARHPRRAAGHRRAATPACGGRSA